ncbi:hypothetical protein FRC01_001265 [Tulasnella sp. 417]|nr:hypothetical protein FRC01_001265 [Tulasnella sp. 417]
MAGRFPGGIRSGGTTQRPGMKWDEDGLKTRAQEPPFTSTKPIAPVSMEEGSASEAAVKHESSYTPLSSLRSKLWGYLSTPSSNQTNVQKEPQVTVHSLFVQYAHGGTAWKPQSTTILTAVNLTDLQSVTAWQQRPLLTILSNDNAERYQVGYTFTVHHGERIIDFHHGVQAPRSSKMCHIQPTGNHTVSPERHWSGASPITDFIPHTSNAYLPGKKPLPGSTPVSPQIVFDGADSSVSFLDFVHGLENSRKWVGITALLVFWDLEHVVPTHLYGEALRYYETLDSGCQLDWAQLRDAMARRFPGAIGSGGLVRRSTMQWDEYGLPTEAVPPPVTSSRLEVPEVVVDEPENPGSSEHGLKQKGSSLSLSSLKGRLRLPSFSRSPSRTVMELPAVVPYVTVQSMFIEYLHAGVNWGPISRTVHATVDLSDPQAVAAARTTPLITIPSSDDNDYWRVGFTYTLLHGERSIDFCHEVLAPRKSKKYFFQQTALSFWDLYHPKPSQIEDTKNVPSE